MVPASEAFGAMDSEAARLTVDETGAGERLDRWLAAQLPELSRARLQALILAGEARVNGGAVRASHRVRHGDQVLVRLPEPVPALPRAEPIPLVIVYQDTQLLVVDKPAGLVVHPGAGVADGTLVNALLHHVTDLSGVGGVLRPGIVHRLDRGTSGLLVVAKDDRTHRALTRQFSKRDVLKEYLAIVHGVPAERSATLSAPIGRHPVKRTKMAVRKQGGREAITHYDVVEVLDRAALLRVRLHTGRTHQVRVHLAWRGHPLVGDTTYGGAREPAASSRPALHAARLGFDHPQTGERLQFESPLPQDLVDLLERLRLAPFEADRRRGAPVRGLE